MQRHHRRWTRWRSPRRTSRRHTRDDRREQHIEGRWRVRTSGQKPHLVQEDAAQAHGLSPGPRAARRGQRVWNRRHERSYETDSAVPPPRWNSRRRVARRAPSRRIDVVATGGHPTRTSRAQIRRAVEVCRPRRPPRASSRRTKTRRATSAITCEFLGAPSAGRGLSPICAMARKSAARRASPS